MWSPPSGDRGGAVNGHPDPLDTADPETPGAGRDAFATGWSRVIASGPQRRASTATGFRRLVLDNWFLTTGSRQPVFDNGLRLHSTASGPALTQTQRFAGHSIDGGCAPIAVLTRQDALLGRIEHDRGDEFERPGPLRGEFLAPGITEHVGEGIDHDANHRWIVAPTRTEGGVSSSQILKSGADDFGTPQGANHRREGRDQLRLERRHGHRIVGEEWSKPRMKKEEPRCRSDPRICRSSSRSRGSCSPAAR